MKAEHRHQLHTNMLADRMNRLVQSVKSTPTRTSQLVWTLVLLTLVVIAVWQYLSYATQTDHSAQWTKITDDTHDPLSGLESLVNFADNNKGTLAGRTALFQVARLRLQNGLNGIASFRNEHAIKSIKEALLLYADLAPRCPDAPLLAQEALMGVAKAKESLIGVPVEDDDEKTLYTLDQAKDAYQELATTFPSSILGKSAASHVKELEEKSSQIDDFYKNKLHAAMKHPDLPSFPTPLDNRPAPEMAPPIPAIPDFKLPPTTTPGSTPVPSITTKPGSTAVPPPTTIPDSSKVPPAATPPASSSQAPKTTLPESTTPKKPPAPDKGK